MISSKRITLTFALLLILFVPKDSASAQSVDSALAFFPMHVGDVWEYYGYMILTTPYYSLHVEITRDTVAANGFTYYVFEERMSSGATSVYWKRVDSLSGSVYRRLPNDTTEIQTDSLRAKPGEWFSYGYCGGARTDTVLGTTTAIRTYFSGMYSPSYALAYDIGLSYWSLDDGQSIGLQVRKLVYAKVNGSALGTPLIVQEPIPVPTNYALSQNYPNPFNPSTTIDYFLPKRSYVKLAIVNAIGQEVAQWTYPDRQAGSYSISWVAHSASGVYFFRMQAISSTSPVERYIQTRKMLLLK